MKRIALALVALALLAPAARGDGDVIRYDPATGVILPAEPSAAVVERETLTVEFQPTERPPDGDRDRPPGVDAVEVHAQYWLRNPSGKALKLKIGFPAPGGAVEVAEPPVRLDGQPTEWRLISPDELLKPMQPHLVLAMQRWADRHPRVVRLAGERRALYRRGVPWEERQRRTEALWPELRAELLKAGVSAPSRDSYQCLWPSAEASRAYKNLWLLRRALIASGQGNLLPEARWYVDTTVLDPATGGRVPSPRNSDHSRRMSMLVFPLALAPEAEHRLEVVYRQSPSQTEEYGTSYYFEYVLRTVRNWASFGPIETTIRAPAGLVFRSLPGLRYAGMSRGLKVYQGTIRDPQRNLQVVLADPEMLLPRLKINGQVYRERRDMLVEGVPTFPADHLWGFSDAPGHLRSARVPKQFTQGLVILTRAGITVEVRPGEKRMLVNGQPMSLTTPVVVRKGVSHLPLQVLQALYPDYQVSLTYHAASRTVLAGFRPRPKPGMPPANAPGGAEGDAPPGGEN